MAQTNDILTEIAVKRVSGKAQSSTRKSVAAEKFGSTVQTTAKTVFGEDVPNNPGLTLFQNQTNVQRVVLDVVPIPGSKYQQGDSTEGEDNAGANTFHGYVLRLTGSYESESANDFSGKGAGVFTNNFTMTGSAGRLQIVPEYMSTVTGESNPYIPQLTSSNANGISQFDGIDYYVDQYAGIVFIQDPGDYGDDFDNRNAANNVPATLTAYIYTGQYVDQRLDASSGGGGGNAQFISSGSVSASINVGADDIFKITSGSDDLVTLSTSGGETNFQINGNLVATQYIVSSSVTFMTQSFSSGSTIFGDSLDDTHLFTGSLFITGSTTFTTMSNSSYNEIAYVSKSADGRSEIRFSHVIDGGSF